MRAGYGSRLPPRVITTRRALEVRPTAREDPFVMAIARAPRSPQKALATLLCLALVFSLFLITVSRTSDLHVVHDQTGGHFEHHHHRVFDSRDSVAMGTRGDRDPASARSRSGDLTRRGGLFSHATTVAGSSRRDAETGTSGLSGVLGDATSGSATSRSSDTARNSASGRGDDRGDARGSGSIPSVSRSSFGRANGDSQPVAYADADADAERRGPPAPGTREVWDETGRLKRVVEKLTGSVGVGISKRSRSHAGADAGAALQTLATDESRKPAYVLDGSRKDDDIDFENELRARPREVDDEEEDEDVTAADDKQQELFDREARKDSSKMKKTGWW